jgi:universal stress protein E
VINPADESRQVLAKAMVLARHFGARLELFLCDSEYAYTLSHLYDPRGIQAARTVCLTAGERCLDALRRSLAEDVEVTTHVACESPLYSAVVDRVLESKPDLVIKSAAGRAFLDRLTLDANDWQLVRTCPVPLMLTRNRPWSARPRFAAAVDVSDPGAMTLVRSIVRTALFLVRGCQGELDVVFSESTPDLPLQVKRRESLGRLAREFRVGKEHVQVLAGEPEQSLPSWAAGRDPDVIVMGALTRRPGVTTLVGTLTGRLVDALDSDFVLIKPQAQAYPVSEPARAADAV